jgi:hypothetical protein
VFSRTITMSVSGKRVRTPSYALHGRMQAYRSSSLRRSTLTDRKPEPTGVVVGPLMPTPVRLIESSVRSGNGLPSAS